MLKEIFPSKKSIRTIHKVPLMFRNIRNEKKLHEETIPLAKLFVLVMQRSSGMSKWGGVCLEISCGVAKHSRHKTGSLLPEHVYLSLPGENILHPFPIFYYRGFSQDTIDKLAKPSMSNKKAENTNYICNSTPLYNLEQEVLELLYLSPPHKSSKPPTHTPTAVCTF